jgi:Carbohydrate-selective porin
VFWRDNSDRRKCGLIEKRKTMSTRIRRSAIAVVSLIALFVLRSGAYCQTPTPSATPATTQAAVTSATAEEKGPKVAAASAPVPEPDFWHRETMTGDWGGTRSRWKEKGVDLEFKLTNIYQGIASGGTNHNSEYNGLFESTWKFDLGKVAGWKYWSSEIKTQWRFSGPAITGTGGINLSNTAAIIPASSGSVVSVTAVNFTRIIPKDLTKGDLYAVSFGRYNLLDLLDEDFFAGAGIERFLNIAPIGPLTVLRQVPIVTNGASFAVVRGGEPRFTFAILDPNDHSLDPGLDDLFADGVTFSPGYNIPTKYFGKTAKHSFGGAITTKKYTPFDAIRQVIIPGPPLNPVQPKRGSWSASYTFRQYMVERAPHDGWGFFTQLSIADKDTSPITRFVNVGLGGNGLIPSRRGDEFGISYAYTNLSSVLKDNINLITFGRRRLQPEHQLETFYNLHITPWLRLTGDLQIIRGVRPRVDTAIVPGARLEMIF